jgi:hypothetical protein
MITALVKIRARRGRLALLRSRAPRSDGLARRRRGNQPIAAVADEIAAARVQKRAARLEVALGLEELK